ncbi:hypothetical protein [Pantanalinema sp. GBBB05]|uniref:hypothetical protein n=1 Tax=Pantanalinema sp. GBBB05 TaxID=2604139 RepID=UPI001D25B2FE|nr:hypothetical protein [Pantanalinema sp. GBBB05]
MRRDVYIVNDAGGWSVVAAGALDEIIQDDRNQDDQFVQAFSAALFGIEGDDYSVVRIVANEPLTEAETAEWVGRVQWRINTNDGKILISSGFDPDCLAEWQEQGETEYVKEITVPPGDYQVSFYTYLHSMNGAIWLSDFCKDLPFPKLLPWFQQDHPGEPLPTWAVTMLDDEDFPDAPSISAAIKSGQLAIHHQPVHWIGYLIHVLPFESGMTLDTPEFGWFETRRWVRVPATCPLGIVTDCPDDRQTQRDLDNLLQ